MLRQIQRWIRRALIGADLPPVKIELHITINSRQGEEVVVGCRGEEGARRVIVNAIKTAKLKREI